MVEVWLVDGTGVQTGGTSFTLSNITASHTVMVLFTPLQLTLTLTATPSTQVGFGYPVQLNANVTGNDLPAQNNWYFNYRFYAYAPELNLPIQNRSRNSCVWYPSALMTCTLFVELTGYVIMPDGEQIHCDQTASLNNYQVPSCRPPGKRSRSLLIKIYQ